MARPHSPGGRQWKREQPTEAATASREQFERGRLGAAEALRSQIGLAEGGVTLAQEASDKALAELRAQAARGMASQFQAAGRRAAGGGTLAALGQAGLDTSRAVSAQRTQDEARIQAARMAAADVAATKELEIAELMDVQRNAEEQFDAIRAGDVGIRHVHAHEKTVTRPQILLAEAKRASRDIIKARTVVAVAWKRIAGFEPDFGQAHSTARKEQFIIGTMIDARLHKLGHGVDIEASCRRR